MTVLPIWTRSPRRTAVAAVTLARLTKVPLVEPEVLDEDLAVAAEDPGVDLGGEGVVGDGHVAARRPDPRSSPRPRGMTRPRSSAGSTTVSWVGTLRPLRPALPAPRRGGARARPGPLQRRRAG